MSGHSHWAGIKHKKEATDQKRGKVFSKLLAAISAAAAAEQNPDFNPRLRTAVQKAKDASVPIENIERAVKRASELNKDFEELTFEAYGPGGSALIIEATTDNRNRTVAEVKKIINESSGKWAGAGSVTWIFKRGIQASEWKPKFTQKLSEEDKNKLKGLTDALEEHGDVQKVYTNAG